MTANGKFQRLRAILLMDVRDLWYLYIKPTIFN